VALTRAKAQVYLTFSERYLTGDYLKEVVPSMFLAEILKNTRRQLNQGWPVRPKSVGGMAGAAETATANSRGK